MIQILAVSGKKRSGKDSLFAAIKSQHLTNHEYFEPDLVQRLSFGDAVKEEVARFILEPAFGISYEESLQEEMRPKLRSIWQVWGTDLRQVLSGKDYWHKELGLRIEAIESLTRKDQRVLLIITDLRFKHEVEYLKRFDTTFVRVNRPGLLTDSHPSEMDLDDVPLSEWDEIIENNGTLVQYDNKVLEIYHRRFCTPKYV